MSNKLLNYFAPQRNKLEKTINDVPARQYYMALALLVLVAIKFGLMPWLEQINDTQSQLQQLANTVKTPSVMLEQTEKMQAALEEKRQLHQVWLSKFYQNSDSQVKISVVKKLQDSAKSHGLLFLRSRWLKTPAKRVNEYTTIKPLLYSVMVRGDYNQILKLMQEWQTYEPLVKIEKVSIKDRPQEGVAAATFNIAVFNLKQTGASAGGRG